MLIKIILFIFLLLSGAIIVMYYFSDLNISKWLLLIAYIILGLIIYFTRNRAKI